jgi:hypothetical protein
MRFGGLAYWLFYARAEWEEEWGSVNESHTDEEIPLDKTTDFLGQKYSVGANWYPLMRLNFSGQYYHKIASYGDDITTASFPRLINQDWNTDDVNVRMIARRQAARRTQVAGKTGAEMNRPNRDRRPMGGLFGRNPPE